MDAFLDDGDVRVYHGDCLTVLAELPAESVDAIVTDPPYGLGFMGREWDDTRRLASFPPSAKRDTRLGAWPTGKGPSAVAFDKQSFQAWCESWAREALRVLKPGGHLLAFGGTRTFHRLTCGLEDAGFEIRDCLSWLYGSGFPKSLDVSKAIDKAHGAEREVVGTIPDRWTGKGNALNFATDRPQDTVAVTPNPATEAAATWQGWGTALKPGWEPIVLARKPLTGTVAGNVQQHGTGALNIDGCRVGTMADSPGSTPASDGARGSMAGDLPRIDYQPDPGGRWPANVVLDEAAAQALDAQAGDLAPGAFPAMSSLRPDSGYSGGWTGHNGRNRVVLDAGGPSRFFYTAKASTAERNNGVGPANTHPTVKPVDLMRWCIRLITPPGGVVLDPFAGSGTTGVAARAEGHRAVLIEREAEYLEIIAGRLAQLSLLAGCE